MEHTISNCYKMMCWVLITTKVHMYLWFLKKYKYGTSINPLTTDDMHTHHDAACYQLAQYILKTLVKRVR